MREIEQMFSTATFDEMSNVLSKIIDRNASFEDLKSELKQFEALPLLTSYFYAKYHFINQNFDEASKEITYVLEHISEPNFFESGILLFRRSFLVDLYGFAGEVYANNKQNDKALTAYQDYHVCLLRLETDNVDEGVLSFRNYNEYSLSDLVHNEITVCSPRVMNDPYDTLLMKWGDYMRKALSHKTHIPYLCDSFEYYRTRSFTTLKDTYGREMISNNIMWSHYAGQHTGYCIKYRFSPKFIRTEERFTSRFKKMKYEDKFDLRIDSIQSNFALCTKYRDWEYENEMRLVSYDPDVEGDFSSIPLDEKSFIECIYFGYKCPDKRIETIRKILANQSEIKFYRMVSTPDDIYNLRAVEIEN